MADCEDTFLEAETIRVMFVWDWTVHRYCSQGTIVCEREERVLPDEHPPSSHLDDTMYDVFGKLTIICFAQTALPPAKMEMLHEARYFVLVV